MKLILAGVQTLIEIKKDCCNSIVIEHPGLFFEAVDDLKRQTKKEDGKSIFSINNKPQDMSKTVEVMVDFFGMTNNTREIASKVLEYCVEQAMNTVHNEKLSRLISEMEVLLQDITWDADFDLEPVHILPKQFFKMMDMELVEEEKLKDKIFTYVNLQRNLLGKKLFVFVNLRSFLGQSEVEELEICLQQHDIATLYLENKGYPLLHNENRLTIDEDLCEF